MNYEQLHSTMIGWTDEQKWKNYPQLEVFKMALSLDELQKFEFGLASYFDINTFQEKYIITYKNKEVEIGFSWYWKFHLEGWDLLIHITEFIEKIMLHFKLKF